MATQTLNNALEISKHRPTAVPPGDTGDQDISAGEFAVTLVSDSMLTPNRLNCFTSFNSMGAEAKENFPNDVEAQRAAIMNKIRYVGVPRDSVSKTRQGSGYAGIALQVGGVSSHPATCDMPSGSSH
jgi:hypothetical protein